MYSYTISQQEKEAEKRCSLQQNRNWMSLNQAELALEESQRVESPHWWILSSTVSGHYWLSMDWQFHHLNGRECGSNDEAMQAGRVVNRFLMITGTRGNNRMALLLPVSCLVLLLWPKPNTFTPSSLILRRRIKVANLPTCAWAREHPALLTRDGRLANMLAFEEVYSLGSRLFY